jgi:YkoY family integral membrane protein
VFRILATLLATHLIRIVIVKLIGGLYLGYLAFAHFRASSASAGHAVAGATGAMGLSPFWATVVRVEAMNLAFSIDSILVAVAMSPKIEVVLTGGLLGIVAMRLVVGRLLTLIQRFPALVHGAFIIIAWVAFKLVADYAEEMHWTTIEIPHGFSIAVILVIFVVSYLFARRQVPRDPAPE